MLLIRKSSIFRVITSLLIILGSLLSAPAAYALSDPVLVADFTPGPSDSYIPEIANFNHQLILSKSDSTYGVELWKSDGTESGTQLIKDINPGIGDSEPGNYTSFNGYLYFSADDGSHGYELWKTDGTTPGTVMVSDIFPGIDGSEPGNFYIANNILYFNAYDDVHGYELWKTDGTTNGTVIVKDINPGSNGSNPGDYGVIDNVMYFRAFDDVHGYELWRTDGTTDGTALVKDINPGPDDSSAGSFGVLGTYIYFTADNGTDGAQIWKSDGTSAGTTMLTNFDHTGFTFSGPGNLKAINGKIYFDADHHLWRTDGTTVESAGVDNYWMGKFTNLGSDIIFSTSNCPVGGNGSDLRKLDSGGNLTLIRHLSDGCSSLQAFLDGGFMLDSYFYFQMVEPTYGNELWRTDGTQSGTEAVTDSIAPGAADSNFNYPTPVDSTIFFEAVDAAHGNELWRIGDPLQYIAINAPTSLAATSPTKKPVLNWLTSEGATSYNVYRDNAFVANVTTNSFTDTSATDGTHTYSVTASDGTNESEYSNSVPVVVDNVRPVVAFTAPTSFAGPFSPGPTVSVSASDPGSGLMNLVIHVYNSNNQLLTTCGSASPTQLAAGSMSCSLASLPAGSYYIKAGSFDNAGNNKTVVSSTFTIN